MKAIALALTLLSIPAIAQETPKDHEVGKLTKLQRLEMTNLDLAEYARRSDADSAEKDAVIAQERAANLQKDLPAQLQQIDQQRRELIQKIEAENPGWHWHAADPRVAGDIPGLRKDPPAAAKPATPAPAKK